MRKLESSELDMITGGSLDVVSCECWQMIGLMGFLVAFNDISMEFGLAQVDLACTEEEQDLAIELSKPYIAKSKI